MQQQMTTMDVARREIYSVQQAFDAARVDQRQRFETEAGFALQILQCSDYLQKVAMAAPASLRAAITNVAAIGVSLNPARKQAYLVPRKNTVCLDISYMGLMDLAMDAGTILWGQAIVVRQADQFELVGLDQKPHHRFNPFDTAEQRGPIVGVYVVVKLANGDYLTHTMRIDDVYAIRDRSEAWKMYVRDNSKRCPWVTDAEEMIKKTCVKQAFKYWPRSARLEQAVQYLNTDGGDGMADMGPVELAKVDSQAHIDAIAGIANADALADYWRSCVAECNTQKDVVAYERIKAAVAARGAALKGAA